MTRSDMVKGMQCTEYWIVDLVVSVRSIQLQCTDFVYRIFPGGNISYLSRFYGTDVRGHVQKDILFNFLLHLEIKRD